MQVAIAKRALNDAHYCGDECAYWKDDKKTILCIVDGLGHGKNAEIAAKAAVDYIAQHLSDSLQELFAGCDLAIRKTRGVAMGIVIIDENLDKLTYVGVGNTRAIVVGAKTLRLGNSYGIVGAGYKTLSPESLALHPGDLMVLFTDGLAEMMDLSVYDEALLADAKGLAEKIIQDWRRGEDDATVLVYKKEAR